jgi:hypothetical protein
MSRLLLTLSASFLLASCTSTTPPQPGFCPTLPEAPANLLTPPQALRSLPWATPSPKTTAPAAKTVKP